MEDTYNKAVKLYDDKDYEGAYRLFFSLASTNDMESQNMVANMLMHGLGTKKNETLGYNWYRKAATNNNAEAQFWIALYDLENNNIKGGLSYLKLSVQNNYPESFLWMGNIYSYGHYGQKKDLQKANQLYMKALEFGVEDAKEEIIRAKYEEVGFLKSLVYTFLNRKLLQKK